MCESVEAMGHAGERMVIGCMCGTSLDAVDASLVTISGRGLEMRARVIGFASARLGSVREGLRELARGGGVTAARVAGMRRALGLVHADLVARLARGREVDLAAVHGQTVFHEPPRSWQMIDAAPIARALGRPVVADLRSADLAAGGQGAPITPLADWVLFRDREHPAAVVNLGGFCNITELPGPGGTVEAIGGADVCVCNQLLDHAAAVVLGRAFDDGGCVAAAGEISTGRADELRGCLQEQTRAGRSLGTGDELFSWVEREGRGLSPADLLMTICDAVGQTIVGAIAGAGLVILAGGGTRNATLVQRIRAHAGHDAEVSLSSGHGVDPLARESAAMAVLGALSADGVAVTLPRVTGVAAPAPVAGTWTLPPGGGWRIVRDG